jgi:hypothetical protein
MTFSKTAHDLRALPAAFGVAALLLAPAAAGANQFALAKGKVVGVWKTTLTLGAGFRAGTPQAQLVGAGAGQSGEFPGAAGAVGVNDDAQLNFPEYGDLFAAPMSLTSELTLRHSSGHGIFVRARAWYDLRLESYDAPHGNSANAYTPDIRLVDTGNIGAGKFKGIDIYDAVYFGHFRAGQTRFLVRVGRQALDWGEGIFYPGINNINPVDSAWATTIGARIANGGKLPVARVYANVAGPAGLILDGFVNLEFRESVMPACGTYSSGVDNGFQPGCNIATAVGMIDREAALQVKTKTYYNGKLYPNGVYPDGAPDAPNATREPSNWSGWGVSARKFVEPLATEIGVYYADYTNPTPRNAPVVGADADALTFAVNTNYAPIKTFAVSASTGLRNLSLSAQLTRHWDYPAQRSAPAFIEGSTSGKGPYYWMQSYPNQEVPGYYKMNMLQLQYGGVWQFGRLIGLTDATLAGEALMSWNTNNPPTDGPNAERLLRGGNFGLANWSEQGYVCDPGPLENGIINYCGIEGFQTPFAMGYKLRAATVLPQMGPVSLLPYLTFGHDITGYAADLSITSGRISYGLGFRADVRQTYFIEASALWYRRSPTYDTLRDRGQYTIAIGYNLR